MVNAGAQSLGGTLSVNQHDIVGGSYNGNQLRLTLNSGVELNSLRDGSVFVNAGTTGTSSAQWVFAADGSFNVPTVGSNTDPVLVAGPAGIYTYYTNNITVSSGTVSLTSFTSQQTVKYVISVIDNTGSSIRIHALEMLTVIANGDLFETEYAIVYNDTVLGTFQSVIYDGKMVLQYTPDASITSVNIRVMAFAMI